MRPIQLLLFFLAVIAAFIYCYFNAPPAPSATHQSLPGIPNRPPVGINITPTTDSRNPLIVGALQSSTCIRLIDVDAATPAPSPEQAFGPLIDLCNRLACDPWLCVPYDASDAYIQSLALLVHSRLSPNQKIYIQYSDHLYSRPGPSAYILDQARLRFPGQSPDVITQARYVAYRSQQIFSIFEAAMGSRARMVRVLASDSPHQPIKVTRTLFEECPYAVDALSVPFSIDIALPPEMTPNDLNAFLSQAHNSSLPQFASTVSQQRALATEHKLQFLASGAGVQFSVLPPITGPAATSPSAQSSNIAPAGLLALAEHHPASTTLNAAIHGAWLNLSGDLLIDQSSSIPFLQPAPPPTAPVPGLSDQQPPSDHE